MEQVELEPFKCPFNRACSSIELMNNLHMEASLQLMSAQTTLQTSADVGEAMADMEATVDDAIADDRLAEASSIADEVFQGELTHEEATGLLDELDELHREADAGDKETEGLSNIESAKRDQELAAFDAACELLEELGQIAEQHVPGCRGKASATQKLSELFGMAREKITGEIPEYTPPACHNKALSDALGQLVAAKQVSHGNYTFLSPLISD